MTKGRRTNVAPTVDQISADKLTRIAGEYWSSATEQHKPFDSSIIDEIYEKEILNSKFSVKRIMLLEFSHYLENYLWHNFVAEKASYAHVISIVVMINEKFRERVPAWQFLKELPQQFPGFLRRVLKGILPSEDAKELSLKEHNVLLRFVNYCFSSLEIDIIREQIQRLVSLPIWVTLNKNRREAEFKRVPKLKKFWKVVEKSDAKLAPEEKQLVDFDRHFLRRLIDRVDSLLQSIPENGPVDPEKVEFCVRFLEFMIDIEALLPTRRFFNAVLDDSHILVKMKLSNLPKRPDGKLFSQLVEMLEFYAGFEIDDQTGESLTDNDMVAIHYEKVHSLQLTAFRLFKDDLRKFALTNVSSVDTGDKLKKQLEHMSPEQLYDLTAAINLLPARDGAEVTESREFLMNLLIVHHERRVSQLNAINNMPLYPTEEIVWDENVVPSEYFQGDGVLALPKLNLQFLTLHDYLLRNFHLFRLESTYEIRQDVEDITVRMKPFAGEDGGCVLGGWARMAQPISSFSVVEVAKPNIGEDHPSRVRADITVTLSTRNDIKWEWESLRRHDVCFLVTVRPTRPASARYDRTKPFVPQMGLTYIRGCEVEGMLDENGKVIEEFGFEQKPRLRGDSRTWRVLLDPCQYQRDMERTVHGTEDVYETFNIVMRRKPKENNFKAVLETIRDLMNTETVVPEWLHDLLIGYGDPSAAHYSKMENQIASLNFNDTFLDADHLRESFPTYEIKMDVDDPGKQKPPFRLTFLDVKKHDGGQKRKADGKEVKQPAILAEPFLPPNRGPYPYNEPKRNSVRFTPTQVEAIRAGMQPGLTMVVGPPGTGKTDVAVQIISNIYHNFPDQRTLIVTHSNQALNQLFEKIMALDVDERHLLRMGHGEESLETEKDFSRYGRVNFVLQQRIELLNEVQRLQESIDVPGDVAYTCETASHFYQYHVYSRWDEFLNKIKHKEGPNQEKNVEAIAQQFPFTAFFANAPQPVFKGRSYEEDFHIADGCFAYIKRIFTQLEEFRSFELLRNGADRALYLLVKEAKIIAMTCTHAALKRRDLVEAGFKYDNVLMEESAQILEVETFIPLFLQTPDEDGHNRLKRWIMIGDHNQLPPVIKNMAFQKYSNMEQSLFARFVRLVVPTVDLDAQGRARPSICNLYNWRYKNLGNLPHVHQQGEFQLTNPGFVYDFQLIDVEDFNGIGESEPSPYFYQNLGEAEYVVAVYTYMRLLGYPAEKISILTTYNGQKHLIRDVVEQRCSKNQLIGRPHKVTTVDKYQGQQNDYILLSLVRTKTVGHLRDVRRLVVAMSRARLGLIVFARASLFRNCFELAPTFNQLVKRPMKLHICPGEVYPGTRKVDETPPADSFVIENMPQMAQYVFDLYQEKLHKLRDVIKETPPSLMRQQPDEEEQEAELHEVFPGDDEQPMDAEEKPAGAQANPEDQPFYDLVKMETHNLNREEEDYDPKLDAQINVDSLF